MMPDTPTLTPELLLRAYRVGLFPMSEGREDPEIFWVDPRHRGILPLDEFHISHSLARRMRRGGFRITFDTAFDEVVAECATRPETWINATIADLYGALHRQGHAHSVEVWIGDRLVGGAYGVAIGGAFFGESMFSRVTDGSKIALAYLVDRLRQAGFALLDTQFITDHLRSLGGQEISRGAYHALLDKALATSADFASIAKVPTPQELIQRNIQTS